MNTLVLKVVPALTCKEPLPLITILPCLQYATCPESASEVIVVTPVIFKVSLVLNIELKGSTLPSGVPIPSPPTPVRLDPSP